MKKKIIENICMLLLIVGVFSFNLNAQAVNDVADNNTTEVKKEKKISIGWQKTLTNNVTVNFGDIRMNAKSGTGTFNIFMRKQNGVYKSIFSTVNEYASTYFVLLVGNKIYKLDSSCDVYVKKTVTGMVISYKIENVASVQINFDCIKSNSKSDYDIVRITSEIKNLSNKSKEMALKLVMDTDLGEKTDVHFYTANIPSVNSECIYRTMSNEKWIVSKNQDVSMQLLLYGYDVTPISSVAIANYQTVDSVDWEPSVNIYKSFDLLMSYNNSGVAINWNKKLYDKNGEDKFVFYIALSNNNIINGYQYIQNHDKGVDSTSEVATTTAEKRQPIVMTVPDNTQVVADNRNITPVEVVPEQNVASEPLTEEVPATPLVMPSVKVTNTPSNTFVPNSDVKFDVKTISKEHLTPEYIQGLIDRINVLENSDGPIDRSEILMLNSELDAILELLRQ